MININNKIFTHRGPRGLLIRSISRARSGSPASRKYQSAAELILFIIFFLCSGSLSAQDNAFIEETEFLASEVLSGGGTDEQTDTGNTLTPAGQRLEMEIRTSTLSELAVWCRSLGLSESGTRAELSERLRNYFNLPQPAANNDRRIITIDSTQITEYFKIDVIDEEYARLLGNVSLSLIDGSVIHKIRADEILFNRTRNIVTAAGQVVYERFDDNKTETFRGDKITVDLDSWSGIFMNGDTTRELESDGTAYLFSGSVISRGDEDVTVLADARITNAANEEALWSINASRLWLLPGSEFALLNAVLKVGEIPVMYIPFFYIPGDDLFFHPVLGYRNRDGGFIQTTTYILGQPRSSTSEASSISRMFGNTDGMEMELDGLFLRSTGRKISDPNELSLKVMADYYVNLGFYIGLDLSSPKIGVLNPLDFSFGLGFTRTVSLIGNNYTPYTVNKKGELDGSVDWNHSNLFSLPVPFRYRMRLNSSLSGRYGSLSWDLPLYSDPTVNSDLLNRSENMDWVNMIQQGASLNINNNSQNEVTSYQWHVNGNITPSVAFMTPYVSRINISNLSTALSFKTIEDKKIRESNANSPGLHFYAPDKYTIYNLSLSIAGTPLSLGGAGRPNTVNSAAETDDPLRGIGAPISPWPDNNDNSDNGNSQTDTDALKPPVLSQSFNLPRIGNLAFSIDYQITPASSMELQFLPDNWDSYSDVDWSEIQSVISSVGGSSSINFRLNHTSGLFNNLFTLSGNGTWRDYLVLNEEAAIFQTYGAMDEKKIDNARRQMYSQTNYSTSYAYTGTILPFYNNAVFGQTNFQYSFRGTLVRSKRWTVEESPDGPQLTPQLGKWAKEERKDGEDIFGLTSHRLSANLAANIMDYNQNISLSTDIPPLDWSISVNATFRFWISETNINFRFERPDTEDGNTEWIFKPVNITETLRFWNIGSYVFSIIIDPHENNGVTNISTSVTLWNFKIAFSADKSLRQEFVPIDKSLEASGGTWQQYGEPVLQPKALSFSYNNSFPAAELIKNRLLISFDVNTSLTYDLQRHTNSNFLLTFGFKLTIPGLLEFSMSATTYNSVIWRYFKDFKGMEDLTSMYPSGPQNNFFIDLLDSFNFFDEAKRRRSGFKIQRFDLSVTHFLGDWQAELGVSMYPYRGDERNFKITADISFVIQWRPITEIRTDMQYSGRQDKWEFR